MPLSLVEQLTLWGYGVVTRLARPLLRQKLRKRAQAEPGYAHDIEARFGHYRKLPQTLVTQQDEGGEAGPLIWVHAVSLGEARAATILVDSLRRLMPEMRLLLTHSTATGWSEGAGMLRPNDAQTWLPWDDAGSVNRFLRHFRPAVGVLMETEVWPLLIQACRRQGVPLALANARLNERSFNQSLRLSWLSRPAYAGLAAVWAQTDDDARRLTLAGAQVAAVTGNLKFDARPDPAQRKLAATWRSVLNKPVMLLASSREGEEGAFIEQIMHLSQFPQAVDATEIVDAPVPQRPHVLIVPRHPQRFDAVADLLREHGIAVLRRSEWGQMLDARVAETLALPEGESGSPPLAELDTGVRPVVWLGDSMGEMALYYSLSDVALLGGSFEPLGGQNLIEAAACGCPVVTGPHTFNFADAAAAAVEMGAALRVDGMQAAVSDAVALLAQPHMHAKAVAAAHEFAGSRKGAAAVTAKAVQRLLSVSGSAMR
jgi:3-deoxy-D-manno-octulosonic-acid transferase